MAVQWSADNDLARCLTAPRTTPIAGLACRAALLALTLCLLPEAAWASGRTVVHVTGKHFRLTLSTPSIRFKHPAQEREFHQRRRVKFTNWLELIKPRVAAALARVARGRRAAIRLVPFKASYPDVQELESGKLSAYDGKQRQEVPARGKGPYNYALLSGSMQISVREVPAPRWRKLLNEAIKAAFTELDPLYSCADLEQLLLKDRYTLGRSVGGAGQPAIFQLHGKQLRRRFYVQAFSAGKGRRDCRVYGERKVVATARGVFGLGGSKVTARALPAVHGESFLITLGRQGAWPRLAWSVPCTYRVALAALGVFGSARTLAVTCHQQGRASRALWHLFGRRPQQVLAVDLGPVVEERRARQTCITGPPGDVQVKRRGRRPQLRVTQVKAIEASEGKLQGQAVDYRFDPKQRRFVPAAAPTPVQLAPPARRCR